MTPQIGQVCGSPCEGGVPESRRRDTVANRTDRPRDPVRRNTQILGCSTALRTDLRLTQRRIRAEYVKCIRKTWESGPNARNKDLTHNSWATAILRYFFGTIRLSRRDLITLDRSTRKVLRQTKCHHINASMERLYLPRKEGGRGLQNVEQCWEQEVVSVALYLLESDDGEVQGAIRLQKELHCMGQPSYLTDAQDILESYGMEENLMSREEGEI